MRSAWARIVVAGVACSVLLVHAGEVFEGLGPELIGATVRTRDSASKRRRSRIGFNR